MSCTSKYVPHSSSFIDSSIARICCAFISVRVVVVTCAVGAVVVGVFEVESVVVRSVVSLAQIEEEGVRGG